MLFGGGGGKRRQTYPPPYKHDISLSNLAVLITLGLLSSSIDRCYPHWSMSKVEKTVERAIHARSTRDANFDKYKKTFSAWCNRNRKSGWRQLYPAVFALIQMGPCLQPPPQRILGGSSRVPRAGTHDEPLKTFAGRLLYLRLRGVFPLTRNLEACAARGRLCNVWVTITFTQRSCDSLKWKTGCGQLFIKFAFDSRTTYFTTWGGRKTNPDLLCLSGAPNKCFRLTSFPMM